MLLPVPSLGDLDDDLVAGMHEYLRQLISEALPDVDTARGVVHDLLIGIQAIAMAAATQTITNVCQALENPADASESATLVVDLLAKAHGMSRAPATRATGTLTLTFNTKINHPLGRTATFTDPTGTKYHPVETTIIAPEQLAGPDTWAYSVPVVAANPGACPAVPRFTEFKPKTRIPGLVRAYAAADFVVGQATETNAKLQQRIVDKRKVRD